MAMYKMNVLCLHLSDDQGWRLLVPSLPELTNVNMLVTVPRLRADFFAFLTIYLTTFFYHHRCL